MIKITHIYIKISQNLLKLYIKPENLQFVFVTYCKEAQTELMYLSPTLKCSLIP